MLPPAVGVAMSPSPDGGEGCRNMSHSERKLPPRQLQALASLVAGDSVESAARAGGVSARQVWRWLRDDRFKSTLKDEEAYLMQSLRLRLSALIDQAIDTLEESMLHPDQRGQNVARLAAVSVLELVLKIKDAELESRVSALEEVVRVKRWH